jgi:alpha-beta hydrolase superfamily lysophospholipase
VSRSDSRLTGQSRRREEKVIIDEPSVVLELVICDGECLELETTSNIQTALILTIGGKLKNSCWIKSSLTACLLSLSISQGILAAGTSTDSAKATPEVVSESTMPSQFVEIVKPELAAKYKFSADGEFTKASGLPTYEWMPVGAPPRAIVVAVHGLTLHGRRYRVLGRFIAVNGGGLISMDMRGFGRCHFDKQFSTPDDDKTVVNHEKSYEDLVKLVTAVRQEYPGQRLIVMGESLGCTFAVKLAAEHSDLIDGIILSAPAVKVNPDMYVGGGNVRQGLKAVLKPSHLVNLNSFIHNLVSPQPDVVSEMIDDPFILKSLTLKALLSTDEFVGKTAGWGKTTNPRLPILIIQGSSDGCVSAKHVTELMNNMPSDDQTLVWRGNYGHLQLETIFMRTSIVEALVNWMTNHSVEAVPRMDGMKKTIVDLGGKLTK